MPNVQKGNIILNGENPFMWFSESKGGKITTNASIWTITYSEQGSGHALFICSELTNDKWVIYSDNPEMVRWLQSTVQGMLNPETRESDIPIIEATFSHYGNTQDSWTQEVISEKDTISMTWNELKKPILVQDERISEPGRSYGVSAVMIPSSNVQLLFNGKKPQGQIWPMNLDGHVFSTAALAFSENWRAE